MADSPRPHDLGMISSSDNEVQVVRNNETRGKSGDSGVRATSQDFSPDNDISRLLGYKRTVTPAKEILISRGMRHLLRQNPVLESQDPRSCEGQNLQSSLQSRWGIVCALRDYKIKLQPQESPAKKRRDASSKKEIPRRSTRGNPGVALQEDSDDVRSVSSDESAPDFAPPCSTGATGSSSPGRVIVEYYTATNTPSFPPGKNPLYERDFHTLFKWTSDNRFLRFSKAWASTVSKDADKDYWFSDCLMDFGIVLFKGDGGASRVSATRAVLPTTYFSTYVRPLRRHGDLRSDGVKKADMVTAKQSLRVFQKQGAAHVDENMRGMWDTQSAYFPVFVDGNHWILVVITNLHVLHDLIRQGGASGEKGSAHGRACRIVIVNSLRTTLATKNMLSNTFQHWAASLFMSSMGYVEQEWHHGFYRWNVPKDSVFQYPRVLQAVRTWMQPVVLKSPTQTDTKHCGPYVLLALYFLSAHDDKLLMISDVRVHRDISFMQKGFTGSDARQLAKDLADIAYTERMRQENSDLDKSASETRYSRSLGQRFKFPFVSLESQRAGAPSRSRAL